MQYMIRSPETEDILQVWTLLNIGLLTQVFVDYREGWVSSASEKFIYYNKWHGVEEQSPGYVDKKWTWVLWFWGPMDPPPSDFIVGFRSLFLAELSSTKFYGWVTLGWPNDQR